MHASTLPPIANPKQTAKVPAKATAAGKTFTMVMKTTCGSITIELDGKKAPQAVASTIQLARSGFYDKTPCGRVTTDGLFVLQCGDPTATNSGGPGYSYGRSRTRPRKASTRVVSWRWPADPTRTARAASSSSSTATPTWARSRPTPGYTVIGDHQGLDVVKKVAKAGSDNSNQAGGGVPLTPISIESAKVTED